MGRQILDIKKAPPAVERAGLVEVTPHDVSHIAAAWMAESGVSMDEIAQSLGYSDPGSHIASMRGSARNLYKRLRLPWTLRTPHPAFDVKVIGCLM